jgi:hypothetical protein
MIGLGLTESPTRRFAGGLSLRQFLAIAGLFWVYVALSNILYAYSMRIGISRMTNVSLFASWDARLLQHLMLLPILLVSFGPRCAFSGAPVGRAPLQLILGAIFAAIAYPPCWWPK